ncbi:MAG: FAD-dependent oxidoreductase [Candidatus Aminicenantes bacterium]|nr:FAD-dependent oxidoreductase [Candidatus Aminicenantes bacterium]
MDKSVLVIGGGVAGITAALKLANSGVRVVLVEKSPELGGAVVSYCCKATEQCNKCSVCVANQKMEELWSAPNLSLFTSSAIGKVARGEGGFHITVTRKPTYVDDNKCVRCKLCTEKCPTKPSSIFLPPPHSPLQSYVIDTDRCLYFQSKKCKLCQEVCPAEAINLSQKAGEENFQVGALVVASGFSPFDSSRKKRYGYGVYPDVITALELEEQLRIEGKLSRPSDGSQPKQVAFIQCFGSRDAHVGNNYCSRVCCTYTMRLANLLKFKHPDSSITIFYMDIQTFGKEFEQFYQQCRQKIQFIRDMPSLIQQDGDNQLLITYQDRKEGKVEQSNFDLAVLSVGLCPGEDTEKLVELLGLQTNEHGFFKSLSPLQTNETEAEGIFLAGTCQGPRDISESVAHSLGAAEKALAYLGAE